MISPIATTLVAAFLGTLIILAIAVGVYTLAAIAMKMWRFYAR